MAYQIAAGAQRTAIHYIEFTEEERLAHRHVRIMGPGADQVRRLSDRQVGPGFRRIHVSRAEIDVRGLVNVDERAAVVASVSVRRALPSRPVPNIYGINALDERPHAVHPGRAAWFPTGFDSRTRPGNGARS